MLQYLKCLLYKIHWQNCLIHNELLFTTYYIIFYAAVEINELLFTTYYSIFYVSDCIHTQLSQIQSKTQIKQY